MHVTFVKGKPYEVITLKLDRAVAKSRCSACAFVADDDGCVEAGKWCMPGELQKEHVGYFVPHTPMQGLEPDEQCGVGNG